MLPAPKARGPSVGFLTGWVIGIAVAVTAFTLLASVITKRDPDASKPVARTIKIPLRSCSSSSR